MINLEYKTIKLKDVCEIQRCHGEIYPAGTVYLQVSATDKNIRILKMEQKLESKYVRFDIKDEISTEYLYIAMQRTQEEFYERYVGSNINIQVEALGEWELQIHTDRETQEKMVNMIKKIDEQSENEKKEIQRLRNLKKGMLEKLFV